MIKKHSEIVVCGAGLVGMTFALLLSQKKINVSLIDKNSKKDIFNSSDNRTTAISQGSSRIYEELGVWKKLKESAQPIYKIYVSEGVQDNKMEFDHETLSEGPLGFIIDNKILKQILFNKILESKFISFYEKTEILKINNSKNTEDFITTDNFKITYKLLVAADGRFSKTRFQAGIKYYHHNYNQNAFVFNITHSKPHHGIALERFFSTGPLALLPMKDQYQKKSSVVWTVDSNVSNKKVFGTKIKEEFNKKYQNFLGEIIKFSKFTKYPLNVYSCYTSSKKNVILIGDASQAIHPIAGQGFNLGLRDVVCLSKIISQFKQLGLEVNSINLLNKYERKRFLDKNLLVSVTHNLNNLFANNSLPIKLLRRFGLKVFSASNFLKKQSMFYAMGLKNFEL